VVSAPAARCPGGAPFDFAALAGRRGGQQFTEDERKNAKLPPPPEQDSQVQALLRPGLLADVEIIVEKIPDALHVPAQAVFAKSGRPQYLCSRRTASLSRGSPDSEAQRVHDGALGGVNPNDVIAMADPTADKIQERQEPEGIVRQRLWAALPGGTK
jgi:hypothetical protein